MNCAECNEWHKPSDFFNESVKVKVEISKGDIRAIQATTQLMGGYMHLKPGVKLSDELLQQVADTGREVNTF